MNRNSTSSLKLFSSLADQHKVPLVGNMYIHTCTCVCTIWVPPAARHRSCQPGSCPWAPVSPGAGTNKHIQISESMAPLQLLDPTLLHTPAWTHRHTELPRIALVPPIASPSGGLAPRHPHPRLPGHIASSLLVWLERHQHLHTRLHTHTAPGAAPLTHGLL